MAEPSPIDLKDTMSFSRISILQSDDQELFSTASSLILQFAVLGYTDVASRLQSKLNAYAGDKLHSYSHSQHATLRPLWFLWDRLGAWPWGEEEQVREEIREGWKNGNEAKRSEDGAPAGKQAKLELETTAGDKEVTREDIKQHLDELARDYAQTWWYLGKAEGEKKSPHEHEQEPALAVKREAITSILNAVDEMEPEESKDARAAAMAMDISSGLVSALDLALALEAEGEEAEENTQSAAAILDTIA